MVGDYHHGNFPPDTAMRPDYMGVLFLTSAVVSFNAAVWQIVRRGKKKELMENHKNLQRPPWNTIPPDTSRTSEYEFQRVELAGSLDNEGSVLVGPRPVPSYKGAATTEESKGGFIVMTPFEIAGTKQFVMVNRGWVPIDAAKHRTMLIQYTGEGFKEAILRGVLRKEEFVSTILGGDSADNHGPVAQDLAWLAIRPWNMAVDYYKRRWGPQQADQRIAEHGAHHYYVEVLEDFSGDDQRIVRGKAWPRRRDEDELTYVHLTPVVHSMYVFFWASVSVGSLFGMYKCFLRQKEIFAMRRHMTAQSAALERKRQMEAKAFHDAQMELLKRKELQK